MHTGCSGHFDNGMMVVNKLRSMGFSDNPISAPLEIICENCKTELSMTTFEFKCPECNMVYGVTPCHSFDPHAVQASGIDY